MKAHYTKCGIKERRAAERAHAARSHDGRFLLYHTENAPKTDYDVWVLPLERERKPVLLVGDSFNEWAAQFSPDGRWIIYASTETGGSDLFVRPFTVSASGKPASGEGKWQVSRGLGNWPVWRADREIFFSAGVSETFRVTMLHVTALFQGDTAIQSSGATMNANYFSAAELSSFGMDVHAGVAETSGMLAVRPDLVRSNYKALPSRAGRSLEELRTIATTPGWQGYLSSSARATAAHGRAVEVWWIDGTTDLMLRAVRGENLFVHARVPETVPAGVVPMLEKALANEAAFEMKLEGWLAQRRKR